MTLTKKLADIRLGDASVLLKNNRSSDAYYLAGYAIECALKARIARLKRGKFPRIHLSKELFLQAGLWHALERRAKQHKEFAADWGVMNDWVVESRYAIHDPMKAKEMF